ncbi:MAG: glycosyl transferase family 4, partial [Rhodanobacteraceae bacterium]|nr:glycosyl transferase family 4 [Rhodanobacteraceae bacterium]
YSAHREHLYQWLVRTGLSHARVVALYLAWNLLIVVPALLWINRPQAHAAGSGMLLAVYAAGTGVWLAGKRWCLRQVARRGGHAAA